MEGIVCSWGCPATVISMCAHASTTTDRATGDDIKWKWSAQELRQRQKGERGRNERTDEAASERARALDTLVTHANGLPASASQHGMNVV